MFKQNISGVQAREAAKKESPLRGRGEGVRGCPLWK